MTRAQPGWAYSFTPSEVLREREREHDGDRCIRGPACAGRAFDPATREILPGRAYAGHCGACRGVIASVLEETPAAYARLEVELGQPARRGAGAHSPFGPRLPLRADVDWLQRFIAESLATWAERVRTVDHLSAADTQLSRRRKAGAPVADNARLLAGRITVLLALPPEPVVRTLPLASHIDPDAVAMLIMDGTDAGEEILSLRRRWERVLGESVRRPELLEGVPCKRCDGYALERAEPPSDPSREPMWSQCAECRHQMSRAHYDAWAAWYAAWADGLGLTCRRCENAARCDDEAEAAGLHASCEYPRCACSSCGKTVAAA